MKALLCPACGGSLEAPVAAGVVSTKCGYCGTVVQLGRPAPRGHGWVPPQPPVSRLILPILGGTLVAIIGIAFFTNGPSERRTGTKGLISLVRQFGDEGTGAGEFTDLRGFAAGGGLIYTQERKGRVQAFDLTGRQVGWWILPEEFSHTGFAAGSDGSVYMPYGLVLRRFDGKSGKPLGAFNARDFGLSYWRHLSPGAAGTLFGADDRAAIQLDPGSGSVLMRLPYTKPFKSTGGLIHFTANALGEVYLTDLSEHDVVRIGNDGQLKGRFMTTKLKGLTPFATAIALLPGSSRLGIATALGLELFDSDGKNLDILRSTVINHLAAPDGKHLAAWINYGSQIRVYQVK